MAKQLSKTGITTSSTIEAWHVTQSIDAFKGTEAYDVTVSGSLDINNAPITNLTASGNISASGDIFAQNITLYDDGVTTPAIGSSTGNLNFSNNSLHNIANLTASGNISASGDIYGVGLTTSGSRVRKVREIILTVSNTSGGGGMPSIESDDDIILITGNTIPSVGINDYTLNCFNMFYGNSIGRTVTIINASSAVTPDLILGAPSPGGNYTANAFTGIDKFGTVCSTTYKEVNIIIKADDHVIIYGSGI